MKNSIEVTDKGVSFNSDDEVSIAHEKYIDEYKIFDISENSKEQKRLLKKY